ncbi:MAG TPA: tetratricopeptide repeat protein [Verrucomicrobiae bacterium]|jgi:tetratricopeptide (TPR) repeat protein|nr:tetratricopeptide repeat protein [Verrucomicrobiae bacterium]
MADSPNTPGESAPDRRPSSPRPQRTGTPKTDEPPIPQSKALQIFLLIALVITGAAYVVNEWVEVTTERAHAKQKSGLHERVQSQSDFLQHTQAGETALAKKQVHKAISEFTLALQAEKSSDAYQNLGNALLRQGNLESAFANFREAIRLNPRFMAAYSSWGQALNSEGKPEDAVAIYQEALQRDSDSGIIHYNLAVALRQMKRALDAAEREAEAEGKTNDAAANIDQSKRLAGQALDHYAAASRLGIDSAEFWNNYGALLNDQGNFSDAETSLKRAVSEDPNLASAQFQLAVAQGRLGNYAETLAHYEKALSLTPDDPETLNNLALIYATATNNEVRSPKMAVQLATRACDATASQNARFMDTLARSYAADGNFFQAITWEDKAIKRATQLNEHKLADEFQARYQLYLNHKTE